jgi:tripartite-type tricarboxylate transporter receptor subunit TctC
MKSPRTRAAALLVLAIAAPAAAQDSKWPSKPIRMIVPFTTTAASDVLSRVIGQRLSEIYGQQVVVDNRPGAGGLIGSDITRQSAPDGYTLAMIGQPHISNALLRTDAPYHPLKDFTAVGLVASTPNIITVGKSITAKNIPELIALAKAKPGELNFGSSGNGSPQHLGATMFQLLTGTKMNHVPYKGAAPAVADLLPGRIQVWIGAANTLLPHIKDGRLRLLGDTPTIAQTVPGYSLDPWLGLFVPAKTPQDVVMKIHGEVVKILNSPDLKAKLGPQGIELVTNSPADFARFVREDNVKWGKIIKEAGIKAD